MLAYDPQLDAYAVLGVRPDASQEEVEAAFRKAARTWHPDKTTAPDAAARFIEVQDAGKILRDPGLREEYTRLRDLHLGTRARPRYGQPPPQAAPYAPLGDPPPWLATRARVHHDAVLVTVDSAHAPSGSARVAYGLAYAAVVGGLLLNSLLFGALALVMWGIGLALKMPTSRGLLAWAKLIPGRRLAEYHAYEQASQTYAKLEVPYERIHVVIVPRSGHYRVELRGFPRVKLPILTRTASRVEAELRAREVGRWLQLPVLAA